MSDLVFIAFPTEQKAEEVRQRVLSLRRECLMKDAASALQPNTAGLFLLIRKVTADRVLADLRGIGGVLISTSFDETKEAAIREALAAHATSETRAPAVA